MRRDEVLRLAVIAFNETFMKSVAESRWEGFAANVLRYEKAKELSQTAARKMYVELFGKEPPPAAIDRMAGAVAVAFLDHSGNPKTEGVSEDQA